MRISIRRCLSMLRNTSDVDVQAMPRSQCLANGHSVGVVYCEVLVPGLPGIVSVGCSMSAVSLVPAVNGSA